MPSSTCFLVTQRDNSWHILSDGLLSTPYPGQGVAIDAAVDMAQLAGKPADVRVEDGDDVRTVWRYGDAYPMAR